jgi:hypothetical protein
MSWIVNFDKALGCVSTRRNIGFYIGYIGIYNGFVYNVIANGSGLFTLFHYNEYGWLTTTRHLNMDIIVSLIKMASIEGFDSISRHFMGRDSPTW